MIASEQLVPAMSSAIVALLLTPWLARIGVWGVKQWLEQGMADELRKVEPIWWPATATLALAMTFGPESGIRLSTVDAVFAAVLIGLSAAILVQLARIDARCRLLPDPLTLSLLASGLLFHGVLMPANLTNSMIGAALGYGLMWGLAALFQKLRGLDAMGRGDFAMTAGIGAWLGWQALPLALALSCVFALIYAVIRNIFKKKYSESTPPFLSQELAFGPALAAGTASVWIALG